MDEEQTMSQNQVIQSIPTMDMEPDAEVEADADADDVVMGNTRQDMPVESLVTPTTRANLEPTATVKFNLISINQVITKAYSLNTPMKELRKDLSNNLKMHPELLLLVHENNQTVSSDSSLRLSDMGVEPNGIIQFKVSSIDQINHPLKSYEAKESFISPDVITVNVNLDGNQFKELIVEIERSNTKKAYLGGYRNKFNGINYMNAASQTNRIQRPDNGIIKNCRDTQTILSNHIKLQTHQHMSTQMTKPGVFVSVVNDKLLTPRPYQTAAEREAIIVTNVIIIQKYYRRWLAKRKVDGIKRQYEEKIMWEQEKELQRIQEIEQRRQNDINRRINPKTKDDFEILYSALEKWRYEEIKKINDTKSGAARKAALALLVDQESELIATIERYKIEASQENKEKNIQKLLEKMSLPITWKSKDGSKTEIDTPYNIRAKELKDIYNSLNMDYLTQDERLDVLLTLKHTVKEHDCKLTQEILSLIDREADLLIRGVKEENLAGLRKRILSLFLQYIKTPMFNPAVVKHLKVPQDIYEAKIEVYYCSTCQRYLPSVEFQVSASNSKMTKCRNCKNLENLANKRIDFTKFKYILNKIQRDEQMHGSLSRICFLLTEYDIQYLFESIWNSQSILSARNEIYQLHFVRWDKEKEWTPWNTILLTLDEIDSHLKISDLYSNYGEQFIKKIEQKHAMAKNHFSKLPKIAEVLHN